MTSWRDTILTHFVPEVSRLTLVADPDALLSEEHLAMELRQRGFSLIEFSDSVEFRYAHESQFRPMWDQGECTDLVVELRLPTSAIDALPYDLLCAGKQLSFDLGGLFPHFSYPVLQSLDRSLLDALFDAQRKVSPGRMGDNATKDFILRHIFGFAAELITTDVDLLRLLLRLHHRGTLLPPMLRVRLEQVLKTQYAFRNWPLEMIIPDEAAFYAFVQERWLPFLQSHRSTKLQNRGSEHVLVYPGPDRLPFDHYDIRFYIDNLFVEGKLAPVRLTGEVHQPEAWMRSGIVTNAEDSYASRMARLFGLIDAERPHESSRYTDWIAFAHRWAELGALVHSGEWRETRDHFRQIGAEVNEVFVCWLEGHYAGRVNLPPTNTGMVHHVARHLGREGEQ